MTDGIVVAVIERIEARKREAREKRWYFVRTLLLQFIAAFVFALVNAGVRQLCRMWFGDDAEYVHSFVLYMVILLVVNIAITNQREKRMKKLWPKEASDA
jgi:uncharacterized membrane protein YcjF (UPF0283 family)